MMCKNNELGTIFNNSSDIRTENVKLFVIHEVNREESRTYQTALDLAFPLSA